MNNKNSNGFTLIELIVTITIMGIIGLMVYPNLTSVIRENEEKKLETYKDSIENAAKIYVRDYEEDWPQGEDCIIIEYERLKNLKLVKDYNEKGVICENYGKHKIEVKVIKEGNKYTYETSLTCKKNSRTIIDSNIESNKLCGTITE